MKRFMLLAAATLCLAASSFAQAGPFDAFAKGTGFVSNTAIGGSFELLAVKYGDQIVGSLLFVQQVSTSEKPIVVALETATAFAADTKTAKI